MCGNMARILNVWKVIYDTRFLTQCLHTERPNNCFLLQASCQQLFLLPVERTGDLSALRNHCYAHLSDTSFMGWWCTVCGGRGIHHGFSPSASLSQQLGWEMHAPENYQHTLQWIANAWQLKLLSALRKGICFLLRYVRTEIWVLCCLFCTGLWQWCDSDATCHFPSLKEFKKRIQKCRIARFKNVSHFSEQWVW